MDLETSALDISALTPAKWRPLLSKVQRPLEWLLRIEEFTKSYNAISSEEGKFAERALNFLNIRYQCSSQDLSKIPRQGPLIIVANHCLGMVDGLIIVDLIKQIRPDVKVVGNELLWAFKKFHYDLITVNPYVDVQGAQQENVAPLRAALRWLRKNGVLVLFPAGEITRFSWKTLRVTEQPWKENIGKFIQLKGAQNYLPYVKAKNPYALEVADNAEQITACKNFRELENLISPASEKIMPILFKKYDLLRFRYLGYGIDPDFSGVIDALGFVDIKLAPRKTIQLFVGEKNADIMYSYLDQHELAVA